jgi:DHA1 family tetracycline resistance protein-like MFS transporter
MSIEKDRTKSIMLPIFLTVFIDLLGVGIVIPILAPLLFNTAIPLLPVETSMHSRTIILGFLIASYPIAQFFGAPILGALSDRSGRKRVLTFSLAGTLVGYILFAIGIQTHNIYLLFFSRILDGFTGGNISIALSAISDISDEKSKARNFGMVGAAFGLGFILGPYIGGRLADNTLVSWFNFSTPYWFSAILTSINIILIFTNLPETLKVKINTPVSAFTGFRNIKKAMELKNLRALFMVVFFITLGFSFFTQFFQVYMIEKFNFTISAIADVFAYVGIWIVVAQGGLQRPLSKKFKPVQILRISAIILPAALLMVIFPDKSSYVYVITPFISMSQGLTAPNSNALVSSQADSTQQGQILGINQSIQSLAMAIPPIIAAYVNVIHINLPIICSSFFIFLGWLVLLVFYKENKNTVPS